MSKTLYWLFVCVICFYLTACGDKATYVATATNVNKPVSEVIKDIESEKFSDVRSVDLITFEKVQGITIFSENSCFLKTGLDQVNSASVEEANPTFLKLFSDNKLGSYVHTGYFSAGTTGVLKLIISHSTYNKLLAKCQSAPKAAE